MREFCMSAESNLREPKSQAWLKRTKKIAELRLKKEKNYQKSKFNFPFSTSSNFNA